ncbi:MAG: hypothetical protein LBV38_00835 [Alistipes sp.]|nr:hypothetical protein [Alistipes sp.]
MSTTDKYIEIKNTHPEMRKCFVAFGNSQFEEGKVKAGIMPDEKIHSYGACLYGTKEGLDEYMNALDVILTRISKECDPQDVYEYEFSNHECGYTGDDTDAIKLIVAYFGEETAKTVKRRNGWADIDELFNPERKEADNEVINKLPM